MKNDLLTTPLKVRVGMIAIAVLLLFLVYVFQRVNYAGFIFYLMSVDGLTFPNTAFALNRTIRLIINDTLSMVLIFALFQRRSYLKLSWTIFLFELLLLLPAYLWIKLTWEGPSEISSPLLSPIHRMIVNPLLMIVLIGGFYYQRYFSSNEAL